MKLGADGKFQWSVRSDVLGYVGALDTSARGTLVLLADRAGTVVWADSTVDNGRAGAGAARGGRAAALGAGRGAALAGAPERRIRPGARWSPGSVVDLRRHHGADSTWPARRSGRAPLPTDGLCGAISRAEACGPTGPITSVTVCGSLRRHHDCLAPTGSRPQGEDGIAVQLAP